MICQIEFTIKKIVNATESSVELYRDIYRNAGRLSMIRIAKCPQLSSSP